MSSLKDSKSPCARLCHIVKWDDFPGYGFNLHAQKGKNGQFIGKVDDGSPSQAAGLRQGDRIIEVNEIDIANETHNQVVERIKAFANETKLLVVDQEADDYFRENNIIIKGAMPNIKVIKTPERNPNSVEDRSDGSNCSVDESTQKSIGSNDTAHSNSSTVVQTTTGNSSSGNESSSMRENGNGDVNHVHGTGNGSVESSANNSEPRSEGLNLKMSVKELREQLAKRKKYDPKKESIGFKDKFDIVQKL
ncbi:Na(+)/H(+) exchange regulatory cofactor NHE-RF1 [Nylanderia fulva]|uniref:Na(+)/H(+) exchange regulatory cofactor NHE-RF1 n=1 Tax=Nylanderia fulva TaxID=613905 RepID=UPI0010FBA9DF|nr:Na(+)/H(+) exchange regulatory cofactor NHE-RF1 [Nylanderia fulva]